MSDEGATPRELILEASRRNNTSLLEDVLADLTKSAPKGTKPADYVAKILNEARDGVGNGALHVAATFGSLEVIDLLLDQEGLEIDELDRMEQDTPLHKGVRFINSLEREQWEAGHAIVEMLVDAGCDPRIRNKAKLKPVELVDPRNTVLRSILQRAEFSIAAGADVVADDDDDGPTGSASDSD